ncbi:MAG: S8 family serine peptidase, partial [Acidobacteriota bacterium]
DQNQFDQSEFGLYHSSFGATVDGNVKPEMIAPAMFIAAPILPKTDDHRIAATLSILLAAPDYSFRSRLAKSLTDTGLNSAILGLSNDGARRLIEAELMDRKIVATHYQHVDGTSFASPITASVAALMLQANPRLTPVIVKDILITTASRLGGHPTIRQGFGILNARSAVELASKEEHSFDRRNYFPPRIERNRILFCFHDDAAKKVTLCGDFNGWDHESTPFVRNGDGLWKASITCHAAGSYRYKFLIDGLRWSEDPSHGLKEDDGLGGFNSILSIA